MVDGHPDSGAQGAPQPTEVGVLKKVLVLAAIAVAGYVTYAKVTASRQERDLWNEATAAPDLR